MRYDLYHYEGDDRFVAFSEHAFRMHWPSLDYRHVGSVVASGPEHVFELTQHRDAPWTDLPTVLLTPRDALVLSATRAAHPAANSSVVLKIRSTSVGDVLVDVHGTAFGVRGSGFIELPKVEVARG